MRQRGNGHGWETNVGLVGLALCIVLGAGGVSSRAASDGERSPETVDDWWSGVQRQIADAEYTVTWQDATYLEDLDAAWQAPNRANGFCTYFTDDGIR